MGQFSSALHILRTSDIGRNPGLCGPDVGAQVEAEVVCGGKLILQSGKCS